MRHVFVRPARKEDATQVVEWSRNTKDNLFDPDVIKYPTSFTRCAFDKSGPILYAPVQRPFFMEALAIRPSADALTVALALKEVTHNLITEAYDGGVGEIYQVCKEQSTIDFSLKHHWKELPWRVMRIKLKDLE